jgi:protein ImuB
MEKRFCTIWFPRLKTDWFSIRHPGLAALPFVLALPDHGRMLVAEANEHAYAEGIHKGMAIADARAIFPALQVKDDQPDLAAGLLKRIGEWCIRYTPCVSIDLPDALIMDVSGCAHLWGGEEKYLGGIIRRFNELGYHVRAAMAGTIGAAWALTHYGEQAAIVANNDQAALFSLPPAALRLEPETVERLEKLGLNHISQFVNMPASALRRRFGKPILQRLNQALGNEEESIIPIMAPEPFEERLPCIEPIVTATGISIALDRLLQTLCSRLQKEGKGLRTAIFKCYRLDGKIETVQTGTSRASNSPAHIFKLFEYKLGSIEPDLGIELFILQAPKVEDVSAAQEKLWENTNGLENNQLAELLDRITGKIGTACVHRYLPDEHYWPERSFKEATDLAELPASAWQKEKPRPLQLLQNPLLIEVTAPVPDYPPMLFRYKGILHKIVKADGPERIEQEWWLQQGQHRDYYCVEDEEGHRYWLFRSGHYDIGKTYSWFLHGFFA